MPASTSGPAAVIGGGMQEQTTVRSADPADRHESVPAGPGPRVGAQAFVEVDADGRYVEADDEALVVYGVDLEELRQRRIGDFAVAGLGPIHRALFLWVARNGHDFGGGDSTVVSPDGRQTPIRCTSIRRCGDRFRIEFTVVAGDAVPPHSHALAAVLDAWRAAERDIESTDSDPDYSLARTVAASLRGIYQFVVDEKTAADEVEPTDESLLSVAAEPVERPRPPSPD